VSTLGSRCIDRSGGSATPSDASVFGMVVDGSPWSIPLLPASVCAGARPSVVVTNCGCKGARGVGLISTVGLRQTRGTSSSGSSNSVDVDRHIVLLHFHPNDPETATDDILYKLVVV
jgi:hypothetical protein